MPSMAQWLNEDGSNMICCMAICSNPKNAKYRFHNLKKITFFETLWPIDFT